MIPLFNVIIISLYRTFNIFGTFGTFRRSNGQVTR
jgi:hypothetical protein